MSQSFILFETAPGIEDIAQDEIQQVLQRQVNLIKIRPGELRLNEPVAHRVFHDLRTVYAVYLGLHYAVPRPKALLGHQNFTQLTERIQDVVKAGKPATFSTIMLNAAGSESRVMQRIIQGLAKTLQLSVDDAADLLIRIRKSPRSSGWDVLIRTTPRPLSTRDYRRVNYEGALNAVVARALWHLIPDVVQHDAIILNVASGSGTILIESDKTPDTVKIGLDNNPQAIQAAQVNANAQNRDDLVWCQGDAVSMPLGNASVDVLIADLPFGNLISDHEENQRFYPLLFQDAARVARPNAPFLILTHEIKLMEQILAKNSHWTKIFERRINLRGLHPRIYLLSRCE